MAGQPKRRARKHSEATSGTDAAAMPPPGPAVELGESIQGGQRAEARARARTPARGAPAERPKPAYLPGVTRVADDHVAQTMQQLTEALQASLSVDIERTHPLWCKGWLETYELQSPDVRELRAYLQSEYGGATYRILVLNPSGALLYVAKLDISGQPKERGRVITRDSWDPVTEAPAKVAPAPAAAANGGADHALLLEMMKMVREGAADQLSSVRDMITQSRAETKDLISSVVQVRASENAQKSFGAQLTELAETTKTIERVRKTLAGPQPKAPDAPAAPPGDDLDPLVSEAKKAFAHKFVHSMMGDQQQQPQQQPQQAGQQAPAPQQQPRRRQRPQQPPPPSGFRRRPAAAPPAPVEAETIPGFSAAAGQA